MLPGLSHMSTADSVSRLATPKIDHLRNPGVANSLWRSGSNNDPIKAQAVACESLYKLLQDDQPTARQLEGLLILDRQAQEISDQLLNLYVEGGNQWRPFERSFWISAMRLSQSFFQAYEHFLRHIRNTAEASWSAHAHSVLVQLLHHRQTEFLLRFIRFKKRIPGQWKELHELYRFAKTRDIATRNLGTGPADYAQGTPTTPEQQYIRLLLLELMNNGQFSPREALWADRWFRRWCSVLQLQAYDAEAGNDIEQRRFVVDLDSADGLEWAASTSVGGLLSLDPSPLMAMIDEELGLLDSDSHRGAFASAERAGKLALLARLKAAFGPKLVRTVRYDERTPVDLAVQTIFSAPTIVQVLHHEAMASAKGLLPLEGITISPLGPEPYRSSFAVGNGSSAASILIADNLGVVPEVWQLRDRSDSGSRLRGQIDNLNRIIPGSLIAFREGEDAPWTVSVVRRFRRLMVDHVEIGVEHIGRNPRFVKLVADCARGSDSEGSAEGARKCFAALYLPPSERWPTMPIKTLLLPECNFEIDGTVTLLASNAIYTLRLNKPIQQQFEFIWTSFTVVSKADAASGETSTVATNY
jgi:hypothetical protein